MNYKKITAIAAVSAILSGPELFAQTPLPYTSGFDNPGQKAGWQIFKKGVISPTIPGWQYSIGAGVSASECLYHGYPVGSTAVSDNWIVSPSFDLSAGGQIDSLWSSFSGFGTPGPGDTIALYLLSGNQDPALASKKTLLYDYRGTNYVSDRTWRSIPVQKLPLSPGLSYIALRYTTIANWMDVKFDNFKISGNKASNIPTTKTAVCSWYPNPVQDILYISSSETIKEILISDLTGKEIYRQPFQNELKITQLNTGRYILTAIFPSGKTESQLLIKN